MLWRAWRARYRDDKQELAAIRGAVRPAAVAVDVGANRGAYLYWLARWARPGRVVAFEPQDELAAYLRRAADVFGWHNVTVEDKGVGERAGTLDLHVPGGIVTPGASFSRRVPEREPCTAVTKQVITLDDYFAPGTAVSVVKIDVEGFELQVLRGAERILSEAAPLLVLECENRHMEQGGVADVLAWLAARGYDGWFVCRGKRVPLSRFDAAVHQKESGDDFFKAPGYCNNFVLRRAC